MNPATYEYTAASIQSLQPGDSNLGESEVPGFFLCPAMIHL